MSRDEPKPRQMFAIPWKVGDDVAKTGAWALYATHSAAVDAAIRAGILAEPITVLVTIELPKKASKQ